MNYRFSTSEAAEYLGLNPSTLVLWRTKGAGPPYVQLGRVARYRKADLDAWLQRQLVEPEPSAA